MPVSRKVLLLVCLAALVGCAAKRKKVSDYCANYEPPGFVVVFDAKSQLDVEIEENSRGVWIAVSGSHQRIGDTAGYEQIKKRILSSRIWRKKASEEFWTGTSSGPPTDILIVRSGNTGIGLHGTDVPQVWKRMILKLAAENQGKKTGE